MYLSHYDLKHKPFQISTDPGFLWLGEKHMEALATLRYGVLDNKGFLLLTGDVGTGKTTLINALQNSLGDNILAVSIRDPALEPMDFFHSISHGFKLERDFNSKGSFLIQFEKFLNRVYDQDKKVLIIIDEAQRIDQTLLEEVRSLSNIERDESKLLNIFFVGQIEFNDILLQPVNRPLRQRITVNYNIETLAKKETEQYINHRLHMASISEMPSFSESQKRADDTMFVQERLPSTRENEKKIFSEGALHEIYYYSKGYPRLINIICDRCLLTGYVEGSEIISPKQVRECAKELEIPNFDTMPAATNGRFTDDLEKPNQSKTDELPPPIPPAADDDSQPAAVEIRKKTPSKRRKLFSYSLISLITLLLALLLFFFTLANTKHKEEMFANIKDSFLIQRLISVWISLKTPADQGGPPPSSQSIPDHKRNFIQSSSQNKEEGESLLANSGPNNTLIILDRLTIPFPPERSLPTQASLINLDRIVESVREKPSLQLLVTGYSGKETDQNTSKMISELKANAIKIYFINKGLAESRIKTRAMGEQSPIAPNTSDAGRLSNYRVDIEIISQ